MALFCISVSGRPITNGKVEFRAPHNKATKSGSGETGLFAAGDERVAVLARKR